MKEFITQGLGVLATVFFVLITIFKVGRTKIVVANVIINLLWTVHYLLMGAISGAISAGIITIMSVVYSFRGKNKILSSILIPIFFCMVFVVTQIVEYKDLFTIVVLVGDILLAIALWLEKETRIKFFVLLCAFCFFAYNISVVTIMGIITQSISIVTNTLYLIMHTKDMTIFKKKTE